jgi:hypothetical protein
MPNIYQMKVTLMDSKPPIWRRIQVPADINLAKLHQVLQVAMGWTDSHLHQFVIGGKSYGEPDPDYGDEMAHEQRYKLSQVAKGEKAKLRYEYDFGDSWQHQLLVEKVLQPEADVHYPRCVTGKRNCPPEDCGGVWGYAEFLEAIRNSDHPEHRNMLEWVGDEFDPEAFDLEEINRELKQIR